MQLPVTLLILAACVAYTLRRLYRRLTAKRGEDNVRCAGCPLADTCQHTSSAAHTCEHHACCH